MNYKRNLMTGLIGLALLAMPMTAAAKDNDSGRNNAHQERAAESHNNAPAPRAYSAPARSEEHARTFAPAPAPRNEVREQRGERNETRNFAPAPVLAPREDLREHTSHTWAPAPQPIEPAHREVRKDRDDSNRWDRDRDRDYRNYDRDRDRDYRNYNRERRDDDDDYAEGAPYYLMPRGYRGGACAWARHLRGVYYHDRNTGHPEAAESLLPKLHRAERACGGVPYGYNGYRDLW